MQEENDGGWAPYAGGLEAAAYIHDVIPTEVGTIGEDVALRAWNVTDGGT